LRLHADLVEVAATTEARRLVGLDHEQRDALRALVLVGLADHDDEVGQLAVGDEGLAAVDRVGAAVFRLPRQRAHALKVATGAGLGHGDRADQLAGGQLGQPALLLFFGAVVEDVGRDDARVQGAPEAADARFALGQHQRGFVAEVAAATAVWLGHRGAQEAIGASVFPGLAVHHALGAPGFVLGLPLLDHEALGRVEHHLVLFGHPGGGEVLNGHAGCLLGSDRSVNRRAGSPSFHLVIEITDAPAGSGCLLHGRMSPWRPRRRLCNPCVKQLTRSTHLDVHVNCPQAAHPASAHFAHIW